MKITKENIKILKNLGFTCDMDKTNNPMDEEWYSLKDGWGFRLDAVRNSKTLLNNLQKSRYNDGYDDCLDNKKRKYGTPTDR